MRTLEAIEADLRTAQEELGRAEGTPTEVYSRIVGYYRSVRNWNKGKREEYAERKLYKVDGCGPTEKGAAEGAVRVKLFVRASCPSCPSAKAAAAKLGLPVEHVDADSAAGLAEAERFQVLSTPTAVLLDAQGRELRRARDARGIEAFDAGQDFARAASQ